MIKALRKPLPGDEQDAWTRILKNQLNMMIKKVIATVLLCSIGVAGIFAQTTAHERSDFARVDPTYSIDVRIPESNIIPHASSWIYGPAELECWRLQLLRQRKDSAKLLVGYPGVFHLPYKNGSFRLTPEVPTKVNRLKFRAVGHGKVFVNNEFMAEFDETDTFHTVSITPEINIEELRFDLTSTNELPALLIEVNDLSTSNNSWDWRSDTENWQPAYHFPQNVTGVPPHTLEDPVVIIQPAGVENGLYDFGRELIGYVMIRNARKPKMFVGESKAEALDTLNSILEQSLEMEKAENGFWISKYPLAFRYLYTDKDQVDTVQCRAIFYPLSYRGAFACSDSTLSRIWMNSAYTLRLCMHDFILDGIKRDRLPWTGDLAMSMVANAYAFNDPEMVRRSLVALGRAGIKEKDVNGIIDYSLWWIISQDQYQLYFGDVTHLTCEWDRIKEALNLLSTRCDSSGFLIPENSWLFIDWVEQEKWTALQILYWWAQESGARLAYRMGDSVVGNHLKNSSNNLKINLIKNTWNDKDQFWLSDSDPSGERTRYPNFLAVISGLASEYQFDGIRKLLENNEVSPVGTPYMTGFENMAFARLGNVQLMLDRVKQCWGGMLEQGATTFWEAYDAKQSGNEQYEFYGRPYGKSLCHAWSSGPAALLPSEIFGLRPLEDGWKQFSVNPDLGDLEWASVTVPTKFGDISVDIEKGKISIKVPAGTTLVWRGKSISGPIVVEDPYPADSKRNNFYVPDIKPGGARTGLILLDLDSYQQTTDYTCGPSAVVSLLRFYGRTADEMTIAAEMGSNTTQGTNPEQMATWLNNNGFTAMWQENGNLDTLRNNLNRKVPTLVEWSDWGGHWVLVTGYDTRNTTAIEDDVIIFADPYDRHDDNPDGIDWFNAQRFYYMWYDALLFGRVMKRVYISAVPKEFLP